MSLCYHYENVKKVFGGRVFSVGVRVWVCVRVHTQLRHFFAPISAVTDTQRGLAGSFFVVYYVFMLTL